MHKVINSFHSFFHRKRLLFDVFLIFLCFFFTFSALHMHKRLNIRHFSIGLWKTPVEKCGYNTLFKVPNLRFLWKST